MTRVLIPLALSPDSLSAPADGAGVAVLGGETMGTTWSVKLVCGRDDDLAAPRAAIEVALTTVVMQMSTWEPDADISRFNRAAGGTWHALPTDFYIVLEQALSVAQGSGGAFDPTVSPLVALWGFGPGGSMAKAPAQSEIAAARAACGWHTLTLDRAGRRLRQPGGVRLDLSGIAKGYGVDVVARALRRLGYAAYLVEVGGELRGHGVRPDGEPWWVDLERPPGHTTDALPLTRVALHGLAVATSGDYRRYVDDGVTRYSHTIDPRTGYPIASRIASVTVLHPECMMADAWATALTVMGVNEGAAWAGRQGLAALFVVREATGLREVLTPALAAMAT